MPPAIQGGGGPLPSWAKVLAAYAPRTAAAMLALDHAHRECSPLDPQLRAKMRWVVARCNRCQYGMADAAGDLLRAGGTSGDLQSLDQPEDWASEERDALQFATDLTCDAPRISDANFAEMVNHYGEKRTAAMVLLAAYGNFQDRLAWALNLPPELAGPLPPVPVRFGPDALSLTPPPQPASAPQTLPAANDAAMLSDSEWSHLTYDDLQRRLERQRQRTSRLPIPSWDQVKRQLPPGYPGAQPISVTWNLVCLGYVPELAAPWSAATRTFWAETLQDRVYEESLFWIQTRVLECNYCMGHCEMLLETAGLDRPAVDLRLRHLASGDWTSFPPEEHLAYAFACLLTKSPWEINDADIDAVKRELGQRRALYTIWWLCRGLYMTRVSDGFQLPLERENVFRGFFPPTGAAVPFAGRRDAR